MKQRGVEFDNLVVRIYMENHSAYKTGHRLDVSHKYVYRVLHTRGVGVPNWKDEKPHRRKLTPEKEVEALQDHTSGMTFKSMAKKYGCSEWAIRYAVKRNKGERRDRGGQGRRFSEGEVEEMARLSSVGWSQTAIAVKFNSTQPSVSRLLRSVGVESRRNAIGERHGSWKGGKSRTQGGYILKAVPINHHLASMRTSTGYVLEHRLIMAEHIGRPLRRGETVHHINGDVSDNRIENLQLMHGNHGNGIALRCRCCGSLDLEEIRMERGAD